MVSNGTLKLYAENGTALTCSLIKTFAQFGYGKFEISAKLPEIFGVNPAYWLSGPALEIDGFEFFTTNNSNLPTMTVYSTHDISSLQGQGCQGNGGTPSTVRVFQMRADAAFASGLPYLHDGNFHTYTIVWDPNYITWWFEAESNITSDALTLPRYASSINNTADPKYNCGLPATMQKFLQFPNTTGNVQFILQNSISTTKSLTGNISTLYPLSNTTIANGLASKFEIDWVKIYQLDNCGNNVNIQTEDKYQYTNHDNQNGLTGDIITLGGAGATSPFWVDNDYITGRNQLLFARANSELQLLNGFQVDAGARFEGTIAYPGDPTYGYLSDCNNSDDYYTQWLRTSGSTSSFSNNSPINSIEKQVTNIVSNKASGRFTIYPNPTQNEVNIGGLNTIQQIELLTATMQTIQVIPGNQTKIDVSTLAAGLYFLRIYNGDKIIISKFIKQ